MCMMDSTVGHLEPPIARRGHKKSRNGCKTCKIRKVKCDERRPLCRNCERHFYNLKACDFDPVQTGAQQHQTPSSSSVQSYNQLQYRSRFGSNEHNPSHDRLQRLPASIAPGRLDPFEMRPSSHQKGSTIDILTTYYLSDFAFRSFPFYASRSLIELWWPFVRSDEVLFHVTMLLSALDRQQYQANPNDIHTSKLLGECLSLLNTRMLDQTKSINDHTLVAIASLAAMEHNRANMQTLKIHLDGLKGIIDTRGGLEAIRRTNQMAANHVFWCAMVSIDEPTLLPLTYSIQLPEPDWLHRIDTATVMTHDGSQADLIAIGVDVETANILHEVQRVSHLYTTALKTGSANEAIGVLSYLCAILQRLLQMSIASSRDILPVLRPSQTVPGLSQSCRLAGCLHVFTPLSAYFPNPTLMLQGLVRELKASLTRVIHSMGTHSNLLLWLLSVGGITAHAMPERAWYVGHLVVVFDDLDIQSWSAMRQYLVQLAFHDNFCDISFQALWAEVRQKQRSLTTTM